VTHGEQLDEHAVPGSYAISEDRSGILRYGIDAVGPSSEPGYVRTHFDMGT